jgi:hypothetical protein
MIKTVTLIAAAALTVAGCAAATSDRPASPAPVKPAAGTTPGTYGVGPPLTVNDPRVTARATVLHARRMKGSYGPERNGYVYFGADVRVCFTKIHVAQSLVVDWESWSVEFADDTTATPFEGADQSFFDVPLYPSPSRARQVTEGRCVRGWIPFEVPKNKRPARVVYSPNSGGEDSPPPTTWVIH